MWVTSRDRVGNVVYVNKVLNKSILASEYCAKGLVGIASGGRRRHHGRLAIGDCSIARKQALPGTAGDPGPVPTGLLPELDPYASERPFWPLDDFVGSYLAAEHLHNAQTFQLLGLTPYSRWPEAGMLRNCSRAHPAVAQELLDLAMRRLRSLSHVSVFERLGESIGSLLSALRLDLEGSAYRGVSGFVYDIPPAKASNSTARSNPPGVKVTPTPGLIHPKGKPLARRRGAGSGGQVLGKEDQQRRMLLMDPAPAANATNQTRQYSGLLIRSSADPDANQMTR